MCWLNSCYHSTDKGLHCTKMKKRNIELYRKIPSSTNLLNYPRTLSIYINIVSTWCEPTLLWLCRLHRHHSRTQWMKEHMAETNVLKARPQHKDSPWRHIKQNRYRAGLKTHIFTITHLATDTAHDRRLKHIYQMLFFFFFFFFFLLLLFFFCCCCCCFLRCNVKWKSQPVL